MIRAFAIESSGPIGSVAAVEDGRVLGERTFQHGLANAARIVPGLDELSSEFGWKPADVGELYVSIGPGSFTGLRIGVTLAKTMALVTGVRIVAVPTVAVLAANTPAEARELVIVLDAKREQIYTARLSAEEGKNLPLGEDAGAAAVIAPSALGNVIPAPLPLRRERLGEGSGQSGQGMDNVLRGSDGQPSPRPSPGVPGEGEDFGPCDRSVGSLRLDWTIIEPAHLDSLPAMLSRASRPVWLLGPGIPYHRKFIPDDPGVIVSDESTWRARAAAVAAIGWRMARAGEFVDPLTLVPLYIRLPEAEEKLLSGGKAP